MFNIFKKKDNWHDGYYLDNGDIQFYRDAPLSKVTKGQTVYKKGADGKMQPFLSAKVVSKVQQDKIAKFEEVCAYYKKDFLTKGMLRLHTPIDVHQEHLGTDFLFVPLQHRERIAKLLGKGYLIMLESMKLFKVLPDGRQITWEEILGTGIITEPSKENPINIDDPKENRFFIRSFLIQGMFEYHDSDFKETT